MNNSHFVRLRTSSAQKYHVLILPGAGGLAHSYLNWIQYLDSSLTVSAYEYAGHGTRAKEALQSDFKTTLNEILSAIVPFTNTPFVLLGESMGGLHAMELSALLSGKLNRLPQQIFLLSCVPIQLQKRENMRRWLELPDAELMNQVSSMGGLHPQLLQDPAWIEYFIPILRNDYQAVMSSFIQSKFKIQSELNIFLGDSDPFCSSELASTWQERVRTKPVIYTFAGGHCFSANQTPSVCHLINQKILKDPLHKWK